jgi:hypothetical protein
MTALNQLASRICHPSDVVSGALRKWIGRLVAAYPCQAMWMVVAVLNYNDGDRRLRCRQAVEAAYACEEPGPKQNALKKIIVDMREFSQALLELCRVPCDRGSKVVNPQFPILHIALS